MKKRKYTTEMQMVDDDCVKTHSTEQLMAMRGPTNVIGYGQRKVGGYEEGDIISPVSETMPPTSLPSVESDSDSDEIHRNIDAGEARFLEFQRKLEESENMNEEKAKTMYYLEDPVISMRRKKQIKKDEETFQAPPNRFGIKPGIWWDGIDRSNGFEKKRFEKINEKLN